MENGKKEKETKGASDLYNRKNIFQIYMLYNRNRDRQFVKDKKKKSIQEDGMKGGGMELLSK